MKKISIVCSLVLFLFACQSNKTNDSIQKGITKEAFGNVDGKNVELYTLTNAKGNQVRITTYGGIVTSWTFPDKNGKKESIVVGFDSLAPYLQKPPYFGALIGRYGNRIAKGKFEIDGNSYALATNDGSNHLHGGNKGFDKVVWDAAIVNDTTPTLVLTYLSKDMEEGYPGNLKVTVTYALTDNDALSIEYAATTDKATYVNLTQHNYYNLSGNVAEPILNHYLQIDANHFTPVDSTLIPTGVIATVAGTPFDFKKSEKIGARIDSVKGGYDHNWVLNKKDSSLTVVATLYDAVSGRKMEVATTEPGLQFYSGNFLDGKFINHDGKKVNHRTALCLETQHFPNSPNQPNFPTTLLQVGQVYHSFTTYQLSIQ